MRKNAFNAKERIPAINKFRIAMNGKPFTKEQLLNMFKENNIPSNSTFWSVFRKSGIIKEVAKGQYVFASDKPIFYGSLEKVYRQYNSLLKKYKAQKPQKPVSEPENEEAEGTISPEEELAAMESFAIDLLKELGYKVLAPVGIVYQPV